MDKAEDFSKYLGPGFQRDIDLALNTPTTEGTEVKEQVETDPKSERINKIIEGLKAIVPDYDFSSLDLSEIDEDELKALENTIQAPTLHRNKLEEIANTLKVYKGTMDLMDKLELSKPEQRLNFITLQIKSALPQLSEEDVNNLASYFDAVIKRTEIHIKKFLNGDLITNFAFKPLYQTLQQGIEEYGIRLTPQEVKYAATTTKAFEAGRKTLDTGFFDDFRRELLPLEDTARSAGGSIIDWFRDLETVFNQSNPRFNTVMAATMEIGRIYSELNNTVESDVVKQLKQIIKDTQNKLGRLFEEKTERVATPFELEGMLTESDEQAKAILTLSNDPEILAKANEALHKILNLFATPILVERLKNEEETTETMSELLPDTLKTRLDRLKKTEKLESKAETEEEKTIREINEAIERVLSYFGSFDTTLTDDIPVEINNDMIRLATAKIPEGGVQLGKLANAFRILLSKIRDYVPADPRATQVMPAVQASVGQKPTTETQTSTLDDETTRLSEIVSRAEAVGNMEGDTDKLIFKYEGLEANFDKAEDKYKVSLVSIPDRTSVKKLDMTNGVQTFMQLNKYDTRFIKPFEQLVITRNGVEARYFYVVIDGKPMVFKLGSSEDSFALISLIDQTKKTREQLTTSLQAAQT